MSGGHGGAPLSDCRRLIPPAYLVQLWNGVFRLVFTRAVAMAKNSLASGFEPEIGQNCLRHQPKPTNFQSQACASERRIQGWRWCFPAPGAASEKPLVLGQRKMQGKTAAKTALNSSV